MQTPNITTAQIVAIILAASGLLAAFGLPVTHQQSDAIVQLVTVLAPVLLAADAVIRHGRAHATTATVTASGPQPDAIPPIDAAPAQAAAQPVDGVTPAAG